MEKIKNEGSVIFPAYIDPVILDAARSQPNFKIKETPEEMKQREESERRMKLERMNELKNLEKDDLIRMIIELEESGEYW